MYITVPRLVLGCHHAFRVRNLSLELDEYARMHELEDRYWWFVARRDLITSLLTDLNPPKNATILDVGCGTGAMLDDLTPFGTVIGADFSTEALRYCGERGAVSGKTYRLSRADVRRLPFQTDSVDIVTAMDIIEHIDDDKAALREIARVLKPGGVLLATVPAFESLWSDHDVALHHHRRYTSHGFRDVAQRAGLAVEKLSYTVSTLFPIIWAFRTATRMMSARRDPTGKAPKASLVNVPPSVNGALLAISKSETNFVRRFNLPFGVSVVAVARKERMTDS